MKQVLHLKWDAPAISPWGNSLSLFVSPKAVTGKVISLRCGNEMRFLMENISNIHSERHIVILYCIYGFGDSDGILNNRL